MAKSDYLHMRVDPELKAKLQAAARRRHIDTSALVSLVLAEFVSRDEREAVELSALK